MIQLTDEQTAAISQLINELTKPNARYVTLTGGSGVGKTTVIKEFINQWELLKQLDPITFKADNIHVTATTNKAADVLRKNLGRNVSTIHSLLTLTVQRGKAVQRGIPNVSESDIIIVDEASFIDDQLLQYIHKANVRVVFVGDECQLKPVNADIAQVFLPSFCVQVKLSTVMRQAENSAIQRLSYAMREAVISGEYPEADVNNREIFWLAPDEFLRAFTDDCMQYPTGHVRALAWTNNTANNYNLNAMQACTGRTEMQVGDLVTVNSMVQTRQAKFATDSVVEITRLGQWETDARGVISRNVQLDGYGWFRQAESLKELDISLEALPDHEATYHRLSTYVDLRYMYASTVNKAQGSTYEIVYVDLNDIAQCRDKDQVIRMVYVAASRAKTKLVFTGDI